MWEDGGLFFKFKNIIINFSLNTMTYKTVENVRFPRGVLL
jgi:hypothetical protein